MEQFSVENDRMLSLIWFFFPFYERNALEKPWSEKQFSVENDRMVSLIWFIPFFIPTTENRWKNLLTP